LQYQLEIFDEIVWLASVTAGKLYTPRLLQPNLNTWVRQKLARASYFCHFLVIVEECDGRLNFKMMACN